MANKLGSGSCRPPQGMLPVLLLLVASIQAGLVVAFDPLPDLEVGTHLLDGLGTVGVNTLGKIKGMKDFTKGWKWGSKTFKIGHKVIGQLNPGPGGGPATYPVDTVVVTPPGGGPSASFNVVTADITATSTVRTGICAVGAVGLRRQSNINLLRASNQGTAVSVGDLYATLEECPAADSGGAWAVLGLGWGGDLSTRFPTFSYLVTSYGNTVVSLPTTASQQQPYGRAQATTARLILFGGLNDPRYFVEITGIRVGLEVVPTRTEFGVRPYATGGERAYLSTIQPHTYLQRGTYDRLKATLMSQIKRRNPRATPRAGADELCYVGLATELMDILPSMDMEIIFADNAAMEVRVSNVWYLQEEGASSPICLAILPTASPEEEASIGSWMQIGRTMTLNLRARTLTF